jgi:hypothetical protein
MITRTHIRTRQVTPRPEAGNATFLALFMLALLSFIGVTVLMNASRLYNGNDKVQGWQEALSAAEAGADIALANLRWQVVSGSPTAFDTTATPAWTKNTTDPNNTVYTYTTPIINPVEGGEGTIQTWAVVTVDSPTGDNTTNPPAGLKEKNGAQWYRIRSTGHAKLSGLARVSNDALTDPNARHGSALRKFSLLTDRVTGAALATPEATRTIEQIIKPKTALVAALVARTQLSVPGSQLIDSYDPADLNQFKNGLTQFNQSSPDPTKHGTNGNIAVMSSASNAITISSGEKVYGSVATNGGTFTDPNNTIQAPGTINNSFSMVLPSILNPSWGPVANPAYTTISTTTTITINSSDPTKNYYKLSGINAPLTIAGTGTINLWVTGDVTTSVPGALITINKGATVNIYVGTETDATSFHPKGYGGNYGAINNLNQDASTLTIYGVGTLPGGNAGSGIDLHAGGPGVQNFYGTVYAPYRYVLMKYDGSTNYDPNSGFYGSFVANYLTTTQGSFHYDESLNTAGIVTDYLRASYVEDPR